MNKMTGREVYENYIADRGIGKDDLGEYVRRCSECGAWAIVEEFNNEAVINGKTEYDVCDDCKERLENGVEIEEFDWEDLDDIFDEYNVDGEVDDEEEL